MQREKKSTLVKRKSCTRRKYDETFKLQVLREVLEGKISKEAARGNYAIRSKSAILEWTCQYSGEPGYDKRGKSLKKEEDPTAKELSAQSSRILKLEASLRIEKLRTALSNKMIDIAEFGIQIRKKSGAKQSQALKQNKVRK